MCKIINDSAGGSGNLAHGKILHRGSALPTIDMAGTGRNIERLRIQSGMSVKELQELFGFTTPQAIYKWQHGTAMPTIDNLVVLAVIFQVKLDDILILEDAGKGNR